jgi:two-component system cell cycle sensor histidine kinase/response regulator CckA
LSGGPDESAQLRAEVERLQQEVAEQQERVELCQLITRHVADLLAIVDPEGRRVWNNRAYRETLGYAPEELEHTDSFIEIHPEDRELVEKTFRQSVESGQGRTIRYRMRHKQGHWIPLESKAQVVRQDDGTVRAIVLVARDISEQVAREEEDVKLEKIKALADYAEKMSGDFSQQLTEIVGKVSMVRSALPDGRREETLLRQAMQAAEQAQRLVGQMVSLSGGQSEASEPLELTGVLHECLKMAVPAGKGIKLQRQIPQGRVLVGGAQRVVADAIVQVIRNAVESMPKGGVLQITLTSDRKTDGSGRIPSGHYAVVRVRDQGAGIPQQVKSKIFDPYFTTKQGHQGMGLSSALAGVSELGGTVTIDSKERVGTEAILYLPLASPAEAGTAQVASAPVPGQSASVKPAPAKTAPDKIKARRVLIMDDEPFIRELSIDMFEELGFEAKAVGKSEQMIEEFKEAQRRREPYQLVVIDMIIPGDEGGQETAKRLRSISPFTKVVAVSGYTNHPVLADPSHHGFHGALAKPYKRQVVRELVQTLFPDSA